MKKVTVAVVLLATSICFSGCVRSVTKPVNAECRPPVSGLKNPGAYPGETMNTDGTWRGERVTVDSDGILWCPAPLDGDENDPRNEVASAPVYSAPVYSSPYAVPAPTQTQVIRETTVVEEAPTVGLGVEVKLPNYLEPVYNPPPQRSY